MPVGPRGTELPLDERDLLQIVTETATDVIVTINASSEILFVNSAVKKTFGWEVSDVIGRQLTMLMPDYLRHLHERAVELYLETGRKHVDWSGAELTGLHRDGHEVALQVSFGETISNGERIFTGVMRDVTELRLAEKEASVLMDSLRREQDRLRDVFMQAPAFIATARGPDHRFEMANPPYLDLVGRHDVVGKTVREVLPELEGQGFLELLDRVYRSGEPYVGEEVPIQIQREGETAPTEYYINFVYQPLFEVDGTVSGIFAHGVDVSQLVLARKEAEESGRRFRFLAEASRILASSLDYDSTLGNLTQLSVTTLADWCTVVLRDENGVTRRVAASHSSPDLASVTEELREGPAPTPELNPAMFEAMESGAPRLFPRVQGEIMAALARGPGHEEIVRRLGLGSVLIVPMIARERVIGALSLVRGEEKPPFGEAELELAIELAARAAISVDNAQLYDQTRMLNEELEQRVLERTQDLESFSYSVSHDLRAPLRGIDGFSQALLEDYADGLDETGKGYLERVRSAAKRMGDLIDDILKLSTIVRGERNAGRADLSEISEGIVENLRRSEPERSVTVRIQPGLTTDGDPRLLMVLMENLLGNAWKFTRYREEALIEVGKRESEEGTTYFVSDNGAGFDMEYADRLFVAFQRLHGPKEFEGTGIGLATVQRVVKQHGGSIWAEGKVDEGATFYFTLADESGPRRQPPR